MNQRQDSPGFRQLSWKTIKLGNFQDINREPQNSRSDKTKEKHSGVEAQVSRYSANNLSSPESAYSTGYSTDGTSPGGAPPDYSITDQKVTGTKGLTRI